MKHSELPRVDILKLTPSKDVCLLLRRQFPASLRKRLLFEVRAWKRKPWVAVYMMEQDEDPHLVVTQPDNTLGRMVISYHGKADWLIPRHRLGRHTSKLLDVYSSPLETTPRRYKNRLVLRATVPTVLKGWVLMRL